MYHPLPRCHRGSVSKWALGSHCSPTGLQHSLELRRWRYIFVRINNAERLTGLASSLAAAPQKSATGDDEEHSPTAEQNAAEEGVFGEAEVQNKPVQQKPSSQPTKQSKGGGWFCGSGNKRNNRSGSAGRGGASDANARNVGIPQTFNEMFQFNVAVMGFGRSTWMNEVLASFDTN
mmetsp:Transcript_170928/g.547805  ORF Transcript_170928/g.547805 Transcript_170928/m.547805 type:complete len:176 (-) Transcript_170928:76-603(-)